MPAMPTDLLLVLRSARRGAPHNAPHVPRAPLSKELPVMPLSAPADALPLRAMAPFVPDAALVARVLARRGRLHAFPRLEPARCALGTLRR